MLAGREFVSIHLDVVARAEEIVGAIESLTVQSVLAFVPGFPPTITVPAVDVHQHAAEKFHALTRDYGDRPNTRTKDLVDLTLLIEQGFLDSHRVAARVQTVFALRGTHEAPTELPTPPAAWYRDYLALADGLDLGAPTLNEAHSLVSSFWKGVREHL
jgi:hypothetical protein